MRSNIDDVVTSEELLVVLLIIVIFIYMIDIGFFKNSIVNGQFSNDTFKNTTDGGTTKLTQQGSNSADLEGYATATKYYDRRLAVDPNNTFALSRKANALNNLGNYTGAIEYYDKALSVDPNYEYALAMKGYLFDRLGNYTGAIEYYDKALSVDPYDRATLTMRDKVSSKVNLINESNNRQGSDNIVKLTQEVKSSDLQIGLHLIRDPQSIDYLGDGYRVNPDVGVYLLADNDKPNYSTYQIPDYAQSLVQLSENQINVDIAFKMPIFPNSTVESIERIEGLYDVKYVDTQPDYKRFMAFSNSPVTINNTPYTNLTVEVKKFNNDTGYLFVDGYKK